ncbi:phosphoenolpyruvate carboxykinase (ATP) [Floricoccus penangensis]|uniref:phosphoenolpyruvate carboxykinase (ATP) n=1 Tax=Floricoccus penangensis TaxID=1859475 RepID=UPI00203AB7E7|nr:phosphoenolpyruvate carboxykinase (ATP) [Floricoccus penangensis]URZ88348.1 phosphoenolpyruvate carboxykinase (ATP) [Floricoccus penangensis]
MSTVETFKRDQVNSENKLLSSFKAIIETAFYGNNVEKIENLSQAYEIAKNVPGTIVTDMPISHNEDLGLPEDASILVFNDGKVVGRTAAARVIIGQPGVDEDYYQGILREAIFTGNDQEFLEGNVVVGLDGDFMAHAHLMVPKQYANNLYSYLVNFQIVTEKEEELYKTSRDYDEDDIYVYANPEWSHPDFPYGLALFDPAHNVAAILGLRYFGELKKATLTLAWATAHRNGFVACHGGMKQYQLPDKKYTMAAFGLSGSGKSTITLSKPKGDGKVVVLHDDAFVINHDSGSTTALEPAYFDKVQDYDLTKDAVDYFLTCQNVGITLDDEGKKVIIMQDVRNGNGRTVKSRYVTPNRVDHLDESIDAIYWIMKDDSLPPVVKIDDPVLAAVFGLTLATKRSTAENVVGNVNRDDLVIEPYANPFRSYALGEDYKDFRNLLAKDGVDCYILNTGFYGDKKVTPQVTLGSIENIINGTTNFIDYGPLEGVSYLEVDGYDVDFSDPEYRDKVRGRMQTRLDFINKQEDILEGYHALPAEARETMEKVVNAL